MRLSQSLHRITATSLMCLFLVLALVPIYQLLAQLTSGGQLVQLCTATGMKTVWIGDIAAPNATAISTNITQPKQKVDNNAASSQENSGGNSVFGACAFCWSSVLAGVVLPLVLVLFARLPLVRSYVGANAHTYRPAQWFYGHIHPRAPPFLSLV